VHDGHDVVVVAPSDERSGAGAAIGLMHRSNPIPCRVTTWPEVPTVSVHAIDAPPATAVYAGCLGGLCATPDVVVSGINRGANTGHLLIHSGTVGAALTAAALGLPALAVSLAFGQDLHYETAATVAAATLRWMADAPLAPATVVNVNVPNVPIAELRGVRDAVPAPYQELWQSSATDAEVLLEYKGRADAPIAGTDVAAIADGYAAVTLLRGLGALASPDAGAGISAALG
jgi:5'-nucleotidase